MFDSGWDVYRQTLDGECVLVARNVEGEPGEVTAGYGGLGLRACVVLLPAGARPPDPSGRVVAARVFSGNGSKDENMAVIKAVTAARRRARVRAAGGEVVRMAKLGEIQTVDLERWRVLPDA